MSFPGFVPDAFGAGPAAGVSTFLQKLLAMVEDRSCDNLISWSPEGTSFRVHDPVTFAKEVLPKYFKHNNFSSFVRQLNMYDFHKVIRDNPAAANSRANDSKQQQQQQQQQQEWEFANPKFRRGQLALLTQVKRKAGSTDSSKPKTESMKRVLSEVQAIQDQQMVVTEKLDNLETDNKILWGEMTRLRDRHQLQQQTINRILYFLTSIYAPDRLQGQLGDKTRNMLQGEDDTITIDPGAASYLSGPEEFAALNAGTGAPGFGNDLFPNNLGNMLGGGRSTGAPNLDIFGGAGGGRRQSGLPGSGDLGGMDGQDALLGGYGGLIDPYQVDGLDMSGFGLPQQPQQPLGGYGSDSKFP